MPKNSTPITRLVFAEVNRDIFDAIQKGEKTVETRARTSRYQKIKAGDELMLVCGADSCKKVVKTVRHFSTVDELVKLYQPEHINPNIKTAGELKKMYSSFPGYDDKIKEFGILALELQ